jgi:hypothetical protein
MKKLLFLLPLLITKLLFADGYQIPKYDILSLEPEQNNVFRVRENFKDLYSKLNLMVKTYGNQTISGQKTFTQPIVAQSSMTVYGSIDVSEEVTTGYGFFHDRGDVSAPDLTGFTDDGNWHDWDLSSIVPDDAKTVLIQVEMKGDVGKYMLFRKNGNSNTNNIDAFFPQVSQVVFSKNIIVSCDSNKVIEYLATAASNWGSISIVVRGWWK